VKYFPATQLAFVIPDKALKIGGKLKRSQVTIYASKKLSAA
jgi:hypothetical protein